MTGLRKLQLEDIMAIKDNLVEDKAMWKNLTKDMVELMLKTTEAAYTYLKDNQVVACWGAIRGKNSWELWAVYSNKFSAFVRVSAAMALSKKFKHLWKTEYAGSKACFSIPSDLKNGAKYAKFLNGKFIRTEDSLLFEGITNDIYEVI